MNQQGRETPPHRLADRDAFLSRFEAWHAAEGQQTRDVNKVLGATHAEMQNRREVGKSDRER